MSVRATVGTESPGGMGVGHERDLERSVGRVLTLATHLGVVLVGLGVALMVGTGVSPTDSAPAIDPATLVGDLLAVRPAGFLGAGLVVIIATPSLRVVASLAGYLSRGERRMASISLAILAVVALSVAIALGVEA